MRLSEGIPLLSAKNITEQGTVTIDDTDSLISLQDYEAIHRYYEIAANDLLLTIVGTIGRCALAPAGERFTVQRSVAVIRPDHEILNPGYLRHYVDSQTYQRARRQSANRPSALA